MSRRVAEFAVCLLGCAVAWVSLPGSALGDVATPPEVGLLPLSGSLVTAGSLQEGEQLQAAREAKLANPEAVAAREASRMQFEHLTDQQAAKIASETFPSVVDEPSGGPPSLPSGDRIQGYVSDDAARMDLGEGGHGLIESMLPMAVEVSPGQRAPIDLGLTQAASGFQPRTPLVEVQIPGQTGEGIRLANTGVSVTPVGSRGAALSSVPGVLDGMSVLYANTQTDGYGGKADDLRLCGRYNLAFCRKSFAAFFSTRSARWCECCAGVDWRGGCGNRQGRVDDRVGSTSVCAGCGGNERPGINERDRRHGHADAKY
jgi:hypothetical protein